MWCWLEPSAMEAVLLYSSTFHTKSPVKSSSHPLIGIHPKSYIRSKTINNSYAIGSSLYTNINFFKHSSSISKLYSSKSTSSTSISSTPSTLSFTSSVGTGDYQRYWMVVMDTPPPSRGLNSKRGMINYYVKTLERVLGSEKDAQMSIYDASYETHFGFCCDIDEEISLELSGLPEVLSVRPDPDFNSIEKDYSCSKVQIPPSTSSGRNSKSFALSESKRWLVRTAKPTVGVITKPQVIDYYVGILTEVLGNEKDAQMCIYDVSWQFNFGFCCELDDECARELIGVPGVLSVQPDENLDSEDEVNGGVNLQQSSNFPKSLAANKTINIGTKKLFVTGLSFYTSEKTLRAAFEGFGELVEVRIIMDKISKRSRGYAFIEYTTEEAASAALKEMNGKIINGWMIVVDVAKKNPTIHRKGCPRPTM